GWSELAGTSLPPRDTGHGGEVPSLHHSTPRPGPPRRGPAPAPSPAAATLPRQGGRPRLCRAPPPPAAPPTPAPAPPPRPPPPTAPAAPPPRTRRRRRAAVAGPGVRRPPAAPVRSAPAAPPVGPLPGVGLSRSAGRGAGPAFVSSTSPALFRRHQPGTRAL